MIIFRRRDLPPPLFCKIFIKSLIKSDPPVNSQDMKKVNLLGKTEKEFQQLMLSLGEKAFKGRQLFKWLYGRRQYDFMEMTDLTLDLRRRLEQSFVFKGLDLEEERKSVDGTEKFLFRLDDGNMIEAVMIPDEEWTTVCISSQAGCALGCRFCATGKLGFARDLTVGEIIGQLLFFRDRFGDEAFRNIVFMGMGEPLLNPDNVIEAIGIVSSSVGLSLSARRITVSTSGIVPGIYRLADLGLKVNLAVSLNAPTQEKRKKLMPIAIKYPLDELLESIRYFTSKRKQRVTFEYILFEGENDSLDDAHELAKLIQGIPCKINLLAYNPIKGLPYGRPEERRIEEFAKYLYPRTPAVTVRKSRGVDIMAACGQLAGNNIRFKRGDKENAGS